jgi:hypothetical protein
MIANLLSHCSNQFEIYSPEKEKFRVEIHDSIIGLEAYWNDLFRLQYPLEVGSVLAAAEQANLKDITFKYAMVFKGNELMGLLHFQLLLVSKKHYPDFSELSAAACNLYKIFSGRKYLGLVSGHLFITDFPTFAYTHQLNQGFWIKEKIVSRLARQLDVDIVLLKDLHSEENSYWQHQKKFAMLPDDLFMEMSIPDQWSNLSDYVKALSKKYAARIRKMTEEPLSVQQQELSLALVEKHQQELEELYQQVVDRSSVKMGVLNKGYFLKMARNLGDNFKIYGYFEKGKLQAFSSFLQTGNQLELYYIGLNYQYKQHKELYPMMMVHGLTRAIEHGFTQFRLGRTALEAKAILGCRPRNIINLVYFRNRWLRYMMNYLLKLTALERGESWKLRNPFREATQLSGVNNEIKMKQ